jgi:hypothetical protein
MRRTNPDLEGGVMKRIVFLLVAVAAVAAVVARIRTYR